MEINQTSAHSKINVEITVLEAMQLIQQLAFMVGMNENAIIGHIQTTTFPAIINDAASTVVFNLAPKE